MWTRWCFLQFFPDIGCYFQHNRSFSWVPFPETWLGFILKMVRRRFWGPFRGTSFQWPRASSGTPAESRSERWLVCPENGRNRKFHRENGENTIGIEKIIMFTRENEETPLDLEVLRYSVFKQSHMRQNLTDESPEAFATVLVSTSGLGLDQIGARAYPGCFR